MCSILGSSILGSSILSQLARHKHLKETDRSSVIVGWPAGRGLGNGAESGSKSIHWPQIQCQSLFYGGWQHNYQCQQRQSTYLDIYGARGFKLSVCLKGANIPLSAKQNQQLQSKFQHFKQHRIAYLFILFNFYVWA